MALVSVFLAVGPGGRSRAQAAPPPPPTLVVADHSLGQAPDAFKDAGTALGTTLFRFSLTPSSADPIDIALLDFNLLSPIR